MADYDGDRRDNLVKKMEVIANSNYDDSKFHTNEMNRQVADVPNLSEKEKMKIEKKFSGGKPLQALQPPSK